jgi:hypothetical protein
VMLRRLVPGYQTNRSNEYKFNCTVIHNSWRFEGVSILKLFHTNSTCLLFLSLFQFEVIESFGWGTQRHSLERFAPRMINNKMGLHGQTGI